MEKTFLEIFTDGGARGNPGPAAIGFMIRDETGKILAKKGEYLGETTNNVAEYQAVIKTFEWLKGSYQVFKLPNCELRFFLDSQLIVNQLNGVFKIKNARLRDLIIKVRQLERDINIPVFYRHITRKENKEADSLVNQVLDRQQEG